eukprot:scaffold1373_cov367-Pinguiococcus_pyrenoidosus.AAC.19
MDKALNRLVGLQGTGPQTSEHSDEKKEDNMEPTPAVAVKPVTPEDTAKAKVGSGLGGSTCEGAARS